MSEKVGMIYGYTAVTWRINKEQDDCDMLKYYLSI